MSFNFELVVRARKRSPQGLRKVARSVLAKVGGELVAHDDDDPEEEGSLELSFVIGRAGGTIQVDRLRRGYQISADSGQDGNRDSWEAVCDFATDIGSALGTIVEDHEKAAAMIEESAEGDEGPELGSMVRMMLLDGEGAPLEKALVHLSFFQPMLAPGGMLLAGGAFAPPMTYEAHRFEKRGAVVVALVHDSRGKPFRRHQWALDGYGRITGIEVDELA